MAFIDLNISTDRRSFEFRLHSLMLNRIVLFDWMRFLDPTSFSFVEIRRYPATLQKLWENQRSKSVEDISSMLNHNCDFWIVFTAFGLCDVSETCDVLYSKIFRGTFLKNCFVRANAVTEISVRYFLDVKFFENLEINKEWTSERTRHYMDFQASSLRTADMKLEFEEASLKAGEGSGEKPTATQVTHDVLVSLGLKHGLCNGHWMSCYKSRFSGFEMEASLDWKVLLKSFFFGLLSDYRVCNGISSKYVQARGVVFLLVYGSHSVLDVTFEKVEKMMEIFKLEKYVRLSGLYAELKFKFDAYSACGVRQDSRHGLRPTVLRSRCIFEQKRLDSKDLGLFGKKSQKPIKSSIDSDYTSGFKPLSQFDFRELEWVHYF